jgi:hypothetical protein
MVNSTEAVMSRPTTLAIQQAYTEGYDRFESLYGAFSRSQLPYAAHTPAKTPTAYDDQPLLRNNYYRGWKAAYDKKVESSRETWDCTKNRIRDELRKLGY